MTENDLTSQVIKGYELQEQIGKGGFGAVYRAYQPLVKREVAIKIILPEHANNPEFIRRFEAEAQIVANLEHPYIVPLYDYWRDTQGAFLVMRWFRGGNMRDILRQGHWPLTDIPRALDQITGALATAHRNGVIHRDLKPENILLDEDRNVYLTDFGIAKDLKRLSDFATLIEEMEGERLVGSPDFMSPEQIQMAEITPQSDIYSLGIVLYMMLTGKKPFAGENISTVISKHLYEPMPRIQEIRPELPDRLNSIIEKATEKNPHNRYPTVIDLAKEFRLALQETDIETLDQLDHATIAGFEISEIESRATLIPTDFKTEALFLVPENPYKGLRAFQEADADDFYGRNQVVDKLLERMQSENTNLSRFIAIVGPSGSGKSSVTRAGLIPRLRKGALPGSNRWFITDMLPGSHPIEELEAALLRIAVNPPASLMDQLERDERGLARAVKRVLPGGDDADTELVLLIDQFEELFTQVESESERVHFLKSLLAIADDPNSRLRIIVTIRADFYDRPLMYPEFGALVRECTEILLPLSHEELREAILRPAEQTGLELEDGLVTAIMTDVSEQPGVLPLMQYALTELFERREGFVLTNAAYKDIGGVSGALARRADELYEELELTAKQAAKQLFLRLVTLGEGSEDTRRRAYLSELLSLETHSDSMQQIIDLFGKYRLLTFDNDPSTRNPTVEVAHEALIRKWDRLRTWLDESRDELRTQRRIALSTKEWLEANKDKSFLATGTRLEQFEAWVDITELSMTSDEHEFIRKSLERREDERRQEAERTAKEAALERRSRNILRALVAVMAIATVIAMGLSIFAFNQRNIASENAATAIVAQEEAVIQANSAATAAAIAALNEQEARSLAFVSGSQVALGNDDRDLAVLLAMEAAHLEVDSVMVQRNLADVGYAPGTRRLYSGHTDRVQAVAYSPNGTQMASGGDDNQVILWNVETGEEIRRFSGHTDLIRDVAFSPDGNQILSGSADHTVILWNVETGDIIHRLEGHTDEVKSVSFSPDGLSALSGSHDRIIIHWDLETGEIINQLGQDGSGHFDRINGVDFSQSGFTAISCSEDQSVILWNVSAGQPLLRFDQEADHGGIWSIQYTPDETGMVTGSFDGTLLLWSFESGQPIREFLGHTDRVTGLSFSPDGSLLVSSSQDGSIILWDVATGTAIRRYIGHTDRIYDIAFSPTDRQFISAGWDRVLRLWDVDNGAQLRSFEGHSGDVLTVDMNPDETIAASGNAEGSIILWDIQSGKEILRISAHNGGVNTLVFTPDGLGIVSGGDDNQIVLWDVTTGNELRRFGQETGTHSDLIFSLDVSPDGQKVISASRDSTVILWDMNTGERIQRLFGHTFHVTSAEFSPDGTMAVTAGRDNNVIIWDTITGEIIRQFEGHNDWVFTAAFSPDNKYILSGGAENNLLLWEVISGQPIQSFEGHTTFIYDAHFNKAGENIVSSAADGAINIWDTKTGEILQQFTQHRDDVREVQFSDDGNMILSGSGDDTMRLWQIILNPDDLENWVNSNRYIREFTCSEREQYDIEPLCPPATPIFEPGSV